MERRIAQLFGSRVNRIDRESTAIYRLMISRTTFLDFEFDVRRRGLYVTSTDRAAKQFHRLVQALDSIGKQPGQRIGVVSIRRTDRGQLGRAVEAFKGRPVPGARDSSSRSSGAKNQIALASHLQDADESASDEEQQPTKPLSQTERELRELGVNVEVETLEDLDVIIVRGRDRDVERLTRIIQELERLSEETRPEIRVYQLRHTNNEALGEVIEQVTEDLVGGRQGRVSVTPLVQPNALLVIGWGEAVQSMLTLVAKLDAPVPPEAMFRVFRLRYASATDLTQRITEFFGNREALGARVQATADPRSNSVIVFAAPRDIEEVRRLVNSLDTPTSSLRNKARVFKITNALAADIATTLQQAIQSASNGSDAPSPVLELMTIAPEGGQIVRSGMLAGVSVTPNARNNTVIVTGPAESMELIAGLIEELDSPGASAQIKVFRIINGSAGSLVQLLRSLLPSDADDSTGSQVPTAEGETSLAPLRFSVDIRTNSIIATGSPGDLEIIHALLLRLDESGDSERQNTVYQLKNAPAIDVAASVNEFLRSERVVQEAAPGAPSPFEQIEREVIVVPEPIRNNLIISATPRYYDDILTLIKELDSQPPQVMIQVLIAEVKLGELDEFGVELGLQDSVLFDRSLLGDIFTTVNTLQQSTPAGIITSTEEFIRAATNTPGFNFNNVPLGNSGSRDALAGSNTVGGQGLSSFSLGRVNNELGFGGLVLSASSDSVSLLIRALQESNRIQILSRPQIRTLDNQSAFIQVGQRVPRIIGSTINQIGQQNTVALENVGLILGVTPRISPDGTVVMGN